MSVPDRKPAMALPSFFKPWHFTVLLVLLFCAALGIRLYDLTDLPNDFYMVRQYRALIIARGMYYAGLDEVEAWQRDFAVAQWQGESLIEPPLLEGLVALTYRLTGERLWLGRLYSSLFWLAGGLALWLLAKDLEMKYGGLLSLAYFLFVQFGVIASRTFMPDPLMVALTLWSVWALHRWEVRHTRSAALLAAVLTGAAILVKSVAVFPLLGAALALILSRTSFKKMLLDPQTWLVAGLAAVPTVLYYIYGLFIEGSLGGQFALRFFPEMLADRSFYARWLFLVTGFGGFLAVFLSWAGILLFRTRPPRFMLVGMWIGYIVYGLVFPYHILTHDYYHLPLLALIAIGLIPAAQAFCAYWVTFSAGGEARSLRWHRLALVCLLLLAVAMNMWDVRNDLAVVDYRPEAAYWQDLGGEIGHEKTIVQLSGDYGCRLGFFGWVGGRKWPTTADQNLRALAGQEEDRFQEMFERLTKGADLFVITSLPELENQPDLGQYLSARYPLIARGDGYLIYDLKP